MCTQVALFHSTFQHLQLWLILLGARTAHELLSSFLNCMHWGALGESPQTLGCAIWNSFQNPCAVKCSLYQGRGQLVHGGVWVRSFLLISGGWWEFPGIGERAREGVWKAWKGEQQCHLNVNKCLFLICQTFLHSQGKAPTSVRSIPTITFGPGGFSRSPLTLFFPSYIIASELYI